MWSAGTVIRRAIAWSLIQRYGELVIQLSALIVLARLIPPAAFGVFVAGAAVLGLATAIGDFGQQDYLVQERDLSRGRRGTALALSLLASTVVAGLVAGGALVLAPGGIDSELVEVLLILAISLLLRPCTIAVIAHWQRALRFGPVCALGALQAATSATVAIGLAAWGLDARALAWGVLAGALAALGFALWAGHRELVVPRLADWRAVVRFGSMRTAVAGLTQAGEAGARLAVGHLLGFAALGLFDRGRRVCDLFNHAVTEAVRPVVLPALAERSRHGSGLKAAYLLKVGCVAALAWPFFGFVALFAAPIVGLLLGPAWSGVVPLVQILCLAGIWAPLNQLNPRFYIALGMLPRLVRRHALLQTLKLVFVGLGALVSIEAAAAAYAAASLLKAALDLAPLSQRLGYTPRDMLRTVAGGVAVTAISITPVVALIAAHGAPEAKDTALLAVGAAAALSGWLAGVFWLAHPLADEIRRGLALAGPWLRACAHVRAVTTPSGGAMR